MSRTFTRVLKPGSSAIGPTTSAPTTSPDTETGMIVERPPCTRRSRVAAPSASRSGCLWLDGSGGRSRGGGREDGGRRGLQRGETWLKAGGPPNSGEPVARCVDDAEDESRGVVGEPALAEDLQSRDAEDLVGGDER